jgi:hypothetical protein
VKTLVRGLVFSCLLAALAMPASAQFRHKDTENQPRTLQGQISAQDEAPLNGAVVYLKNTKTLAVRSFISQADSSKQDGMYHFTGLAQNVDYEVYAEFNGQKSDTKTLSGFDSRAKSTINLKVPFKK